ncbi:hypothetical protein BGW39_003719 [Mortierella sp. 14UC]|nr:hypothetical protein BGW39_003719 [Mortierella sp. 14UC]
MTSSLYQLPGITELVSLLSTSLELADIAVLMQTSHAFHDAFLPCFFHTIEEPTRLNPSLFSSRTAIRVLARNIHHVRQWKAKVYDTAYVYNALLAFQERSRYFISSSPSIASSRPGSRPSWLPSPDTLYSKVAPLAPMTHLVKLNIQLDTHTFNNPPPYKGMTIFDVRRSLYQACWILQSSCFSSLVDLKLWPLVIRTEQNLQLVAETIKGLVNLVSLNVAVDAMDDKSRITLGSLLTGPRIKGWKEEAIDETSDEEDEDDETSEDFDDEESEGENDDEEQADEEEDGIEELSDVYTDEEAEDLSEVYSDEDMEELSEEYNEDEGEYSESEGEYGTGDAAYSDAEGSVGGEDVDGPLEGSQRQASLLNLTYLTSWEIDSHTALEDICAVFSHCPNIEVLELSEVSSDRKDLDAVARTIVAACPKITALSYLASFYGDEIDNAFMFRILDVMPEQHARKIAFASIGYMLEPLVARRGFQRRSVSLRSLVLKGACNSSKTFLAIFEECRGLEELHFHSASESVDDCYFSLEDAVSCEWVCFKIRHWR